MMPSEPQVPHSTFPDDESSGQPAGPVALGRPAYRWYHKLSAVLLAIFYLEIGLFLLIFPWTPYWESNYFGGLIPQWHFYWDNMYIRGAVSGLGVVNLYIFILELYRLRRFAGR
jgi:hypothetical protein